MDWLKLAEAKRQQIIDQTSKLVSVNSVEQPDTAAPGAPYGAEVRRVLDYALEMGRNAGFVTRDFEGKVGRIECGAGDKIFGILAHLDIVPAGEGWLTDPFTATIKDGRLHGRGVIDDKGPAVAILAAMEIASSLVPQPKCKVHLILGCNEETGMGCMHHYVDNVPDLPDFGVTPDNSFPVVFGEKGIVRAQVAGAVDSAIVGFDAGLRPNVVPNLAKAAVKTGGRPEAEIPASFEAYLAAHQLTGALSFADGLAQAQLNGVSCHAQAPQDGVNAATHLFAWIGQCFADPAAAHIAALFSDNLGAGCGLAFTGACMGELTQSMGVAKIEAGRLTLVLDIRHPNDITPDEALSRLGSAVKSACGSWEATLLSVSPYLFADPESPFIRQLVGIYQDITGDTQTPPQVTGGGTYARMFKNHVAFGPLFPTDPPLTEGVGTLHQANEAIAVDHLVEVCAIYARLLYEIMS